MARTIELPDGTRLLEGQVFHLVDPFGPNERWLTDSEVIAEEFTKYADGEPYKPAPAMKITDFDPIKGTVTFESV